MVSNLCRSKSQKSPHKQNNQTDKGDEIHVDYAFSRNRKGEEHAPVVVMADRDSKMLATHVVPHKGADSDWISTRMCIDIETWGHHGDLTFKSDQEPAMKALVEQVTIKRSQRQRHQRRDVTRTMVEHSVVEDSRSNGFIERHVQFSEGQTRTLKLDFEQRVGEILPVSHKLFNWLVEHSADIHNKFHVGQDGLTGYRRLKRKMYKGLEFPFGEPVLFRIAGNIAGGNMQSRFFPGIISWEKVDNR